MQSTLFIRSNETMPTDSGVYTCGVTLTINGTDGFRACDSSSVRITGDSYVLNVRTCICMFIYTCNMIGFNMHMYVALITDDYKTFDPLPVLYPFM